MNRIPVHPARAIGAVAIAALAVLALAACGGSSSSSTTATSAATGTSSNGSKPPSATQPPAVSKTAIKPLRALTECLKRQGITLPGKVPGGSSTAPGTASPLGLLGASLPKGVSRAKLEEALRKCGKDVLPGGRLTGKISSPAFKQSLARFAACMREQHIALPKGSGKGTNASSAAFKAAERKCAPLLSVARPGASPSPSGGG